jgi:hypothetical protein
VNEARTHWADVRRLADEIEPRIPVASADVRERWDLLQPRLVEIAKMIACSGEHARAIAMRKLATLNARLLRLRDDIAYAHA